MQLSQQGFFNEIQVLFDTFQHWIPSQNGITKASHSETKVCPHSPPVGSKEATREGYSRGSRCLHDATVKDVLREDQGRSF